MQSWDPLSDIFQVLGDMFSPISSNDFARCCKQVLISIFNEGTGIGCSRQNWTTHRHSPPAIIVPLAPDHYCKRKWRWTLLWLIIRFDVAQIQVIQRDTLPAWTPCWLGLTDKIRLLLSCCWGCVNRFYDLPRSWVGDWSTKGKLKFKNTCK